MAKTAKRASASTRKPAKAPQGGNSGGNSGGNRQGSSRQGKKRVLERIATETAEVNAGSFLTVLKKQGYEELPLDEIQDRLSKLRTALAEFIISRRG